MGCRKSRKNGNVFHAGTEGCGRRLVKRSGWEVCGLWDGCAARCGVHGAVAGGPAVTNTDNLWCKP